MKILLFAAGNVGYQIAKFFGDNQEPLSCLVLDSKDNLGLNSAIIKASRIDPQKVMYSKDIYDPKIVCLLKNLQVDLGILAWWPYIIKEPILSIVRLGILNFHPSYLPYNRGKNYNFWTIVEDAPFGVTLHFISNGVDNGDIAFQSRIEKTWEDTGKTLYEKAQTEIVRLFIESFPSIKRGNIPRIPQDMSKGSYHKASELDSASYIDLDKSYKVRDLLNILRARTFPPHPAAWFKDDDQEYEVKIEITKRGIKMSNFDEENKLDIEKMGRDSVLKESTRKWFDASSRYKYSYHFRWLGRPIIQFPQDIIAMQEIIWKVKPQLIIETGIAHGGSLIFYASMLELLGGDGMVLGIDIDIRAHNRVEIEKHPMFKRIKMIEGSSINKDVVSQVYETAKGKAPILVVLDSMHTHAHVWEELKAYSPLVTKDSYLVVFDTVVEDMPDDFFQDRPWEKGDNPKTAVWEFLKSNDRFEVDKDIDGKLLITVAPDGYLRCIKD